MTEHQRMIYEDALYHDLSLGELAQEYGISRQGAHDLIRRCDKSLKEYEEKLRLVERFCKAKEKIGEIVELTQPSERELPMLPALSMEERMERIRQLSRELLKEW